MMRLLVLLISGSLLILASCKKTSNPNNETEHSAVNGVELIFRQGTNVVGTFVAEDPDGDGGSPPTRIDPITLTAGQVYTAQIVIKNISNGIVKDITPTIQQQGREHEFFYLPAGVAVTITKTDKDVNGFPLGILSGWTAGAAGNGSVTVKLMHKPLIKGPNDDPSKGHSDLQVVFPLRIQ
jgi:hypothetical protein